MKNSQFQKPGHLFRSLAVVALLGASLTITLPAQDYIGADAVLKQAQEGKHKTGQPAEKDESAKLRDDLKAFTTNSAQLAPAEAAKQWLALCDRAVQNQRQASQGFSRVSSPVGSDELMRALPPPAAWDELARAVAARPAAKGAGEIRESGLRLLAASLNGDKAGISHEVASLQARAKSAGTGMAYVYNNSLRELGQATLTMSDDPDAILKSLGYQMLYEGGRGVRPLRLPNLVSLIGADKTETFLRKALVTPDIALEFESPNETSRLARKLALELIDQLKTPQWGLANSLDATEFYEALDKRFGGQTNTVAALTGITNDVPDVNAELGMGNDQKVGAEVYYMLGLISKNRTSDAVAVAKRLDDRNVEYILSTAFKSMENAGFTDALDDFFHELLSQDSTLPFWDEYVQVAADAGKTERMLVLVRGAAARDDLSDGKKAALRQILIRALLAADDVDGAVVEARRVWSADATYAQNGGFNAGQLGVMFAQIGLLLHKPELTEEGLGVAKKSLTAPAAQNPSELEDSSMPGTVARILFDLKRGPEAESILTDALAKATAPAAQQQYSWMGGGPGRQILCELAKLYFKAGRFDDVLTLLKNSPDWGAKDLKELFESDCSSGDEQVSMMSLHTGSTRLPTPYLAASALMARGQTNLARNIADALLNSYPGLDRGYEVLLAIDGTNAIPRLDAQFSRDQFEERPLIWKAHLLRQENLLDDAEKTIRQAITIDPSDGEEGRGDRMRAYSELADILEARGNKKDADTYREIVKAIRLSEDADQFYLAGLLKRAIPMYEEALGHFSDAYCIQSRLAIQMAELGQNAQAEEHYRRAYELMPDSFGRVESHCFGCERAFDGERAQSIAEKVFTQLAVQRPEKPQVHYLLGYLRFEEERYNEAVTNFQAAVRLDPDYLNAWVKIQESGQQTIMAPKQRNEIAFNILRLDPLQRHATPDFQRVSDLKGLWAAVAAANSHQPPPTPDLFALDASKAALEKKAAEKAADAQNAQTEIMDEMRSEGESLTPASAVAMTPFVNAAAQMIASGGNNFDND